MKAAEKMVPEALNKIGYFYEKGIQLEKSYSKAFEYYQKAAEFNYPDALNNVGYCYENGIGTKIDHSKAFLSFGFD